MEEISVILKGIAEIDNFGTVKFNHDDAQDLQNIIIKQMGMCSARTGKSPYKSKEFLGVLTLVMTPMDINPEIKGGVTHEDKECDW